MQQWCVYTSRDSKPIKYSISMLYETYFSILNFFFLPFGICYIIWTPLGCCFAIAGPAHAPYRCFFFFLTSSSLLCVCVFGAKQMIRSMYLFLFSVLSYRINSIMHTMPYSCVLPIVVLLWCDPACSSALAHNTPRTRMSIIKTLCQ